MVEIIKRWQRYATAAGPCRFHKNVTKKVLGAFCSSVVLRRAVCATRGLGQQQLCPPQEQSRGLACLSDGDLELLGGKVLLIPGERRGRMLPTATQSMVI